MTWGFESLRGGVTRDELIAELQKYPNVTVRLDVLQPSLDWGAEDHIAENEAWGVKQEIHSGKPCIYVTGGKW